MIVDSRYRATGPLDAQPGNASGRKSNVASVSSANKSKFSGAMIAAAVAAAATMGVAAYFLINRRYDSSDAKKSDTIEKGSSSSIISVDGPKDISDVDLLSGDSEMTSAFHDIADPSLPPHPEYRARGPSDDDIYTHSTGMTHSRSFVNEDAEVPVTSVISAASIGSRMPISTDMHSSYRDSTTVTTSIDRPISSISTSESTIGENRINSGAGAFMSTERIEPFMSATQPTSVEREGQSISSLPQFTGTMISTSSTTTNVNAATEDITQRHDDKALATDRASITTTISAVLPENREHISKSDTSVTSASDVISDMTASMSYTKPIPLNAVVSSSSDSVSGTEGASVSVTSSLYTSAERHESPSLHMNTDGPDVTSALLYINDGDAATVSLETLNRECISTEAKDYADDEKASQPSEGQLTQSQTEELQNLKDTSISAPIPVASSLPKKEKLPDILVNSTKHDVDQSEAKDLAKQNKQSKKGKHQKSSTSSAVVKLRTGVQRGWQRMTQRISGIGKSHKTQDDTTSSLGRNTNIGARDLLKRKDHRSSDDIVSSVENEENKSYSIGGLLGHKKSKSGMQRQRRHDTEDSESDDSTRESDKAQDKHLYEDIEIVLAKKRQMDVERDTQHEQQTVERREAPKLPKRPATMIQEDDIKQVPLINDEDAITDEERLRREEAELGELSFAYQDPSEIRDNVSEHEGQLVVAKEEEAKDVDYKNMQSADNEHSVETKKEYGSEAENEHDTEMEQRAGETSEAMTHTVHMIQSQLGYRDVPAQHKTSARVLRSGAQGDSYLADALTEQMDRQDADRLQAEARQLSNEQVFSISYGGVEYNIRADDLAKDLGIDVHKMSAAREIHLDTQEHSNAVRSISSVNDMEGVHESNHNVIRAKIQQAMREPVTVNPSTEPVSRVLHDALEKHRHVTEQPEHEALGHALQQECVSEHNRRVYEFFTTNNRTQIRDSDEMSEPGHRGEAAADDEEGVVFLDSLQHKEEVAQHTDAQDADSEHNEHAKGADMHHDVRMLHNVINHTQHTERAPEHVEQTAASDAQNMVNVNDTQDNFEGAVQDEHDDQQAYEQDEEYVEQAIERAERKIVVVPSSIHKDFDAHDLVMHNVQSAQQKQADILHKALQEERVQPLRDDLEQEGIDHVAQDDVSEHESEDKAQTNVEEMHLLSEMDAQTVDEAAMKMMLQTSLEQADRRRIEKERQDEIERERQDEIMRKLEAKEAERQALEKQELEKQELEKQELIRFKQEIDQREQAKTDALLKKQEQEFEEVEKQEKERIELEKQEREKRYDEIKETIKHPHKTLFVEQNAPRQPRQQNVWAAAEQRRYELERKMLDKQELARQELEKQELARQELEEQELEEQELEKQEQELEKQELEEQELEEQSPLLKYTQEIEARMLESDAQSSESKEKYEQIEQMLDKQNLNRQAMEKQILEQQELQRQAQDQERKRSLAERQKRERLEFEQRTQERERLEDERQKLLETQALQRQMLEAEVKEEQSRQESEEERQAMKESALAALQKQAEAEQEEERIRASDEKQRILEEIKAQRQDEIKRQQQHFKTLLDLFEKQNTGTQDLDRGASQAEDDETYRATDHAKQALERQTFVRAMHTDGADESHGFMMFNDDTKEGVAATYKQTQEEAHAQLQAQMQNGDTQHKVDRKVDYEATQEQDAVTREVLQNSMQAQLEESARDDAPQKYEDDESSENSEDDEDKGAINTQHEQTHMVDELHGGQTKIVHLEHNVGSRAQNVVHGDSLMQEIATDTDSHNNNAHVRGDETHVEGNAAPQIETNEPDAETKAHTQQKPERTTDKAPEAEGELSLQSDGGASAAIPGTHAATEPLARDTYINMTPGLFGNRRTDRTSKTYMNMTEAIKSRSQSTSQKLYTSRHSDAYVPMVAPRSVDDSALPTLFFEQPLPYSEQQLPYVSDDNGVRYPFNSGNYAESQSSYYTAKTNQEDSDSDSTIIDNTETREIHDNTMMRDNVTNSTKAQEDRTSMIDASMAETEMPLPSGHMNVDSRIADVAVFAGMRAPDARRAQRSADESGPSRSVLESVESDNDLTSLQGEGFLAEGQFVSDARTIGASIPLSRLQSSNTRAYDSPERRAPAVSDADERTFNINDGSTSISRDDERMTKHNTDETQAKRFVRGVDGKLYSDATLGKQEVKQRQGIFSGLINLMLGERESEDQSYNEDDNSLDQHAEDVVYVSPQKLQQTHSDGSEPQFLSPPQSESDDTDVDTDGSLKDGDTSDADTDHDETDDDTQKKKIKSDSFGSHVDSAGVGLDVNDGDTSVDANVSADTSASVSTDSNTEGAGVIAKDTYTSDSSLDDSVNSDGAGACADVSSSSETNNTETDSVTELVESADEAMSTTQARQQRKQHIRMLEQLLKAMKKQNDDMRHGRQPHNPMVIINDAPMSLSLLDCTNLISNFETKILAPLEQKMQRNLIQRSVQMLYDEEAQQEGADIFYIKDLIQDIRRQIFANSVYSSQTALNQFKQLSQTKKKVTDSYENDDQDAQTQGTTDSGNVNIDETSQTQDDNHVEGAAASPTQEDDSDAIYMQRCAEILNSILQVIKNKSKDYKTHNYPLISIDGETITLSPDMCYQLADKYSASASKQIQELAAKKDTKLKPGESATTFDKYARWTRVLNAADDVRLQTLRNE